MPPDVPWTMPTAPGLREDPRIDLSLEILRCGTIRLTAWGTSMLPSIWPGDLLEIEPVKHDQIVRGDIVLALRNHRVFIHRVIGTNARNESRHWITRGDSMPQNDPPSTESDLPGRVVLIHRGGRSFAPSRKISILNSLLAWILCRSDRIRNLALRIHAATLRIVKLRTDPATGVDPAEDATGTACLPYISESSTLQV
jgi:hypothetical protein